MKVIVYNDRDLNVIEEYSTQNENDFEVMEFKFSSLFDNYNKKIVFLTPDGNISYYIKNNKFFIPREITQYDQVKFYIWCTFENKDFRTKLKILSFNKNENVNIEILPLEKTQIEQIINELEKNILIVQNLEKQTTNLIDEIETKLKNGDFKGDKGDKGDPGESYDDTEIKEEISDIKEEQTTQNTRIEELEEQVQELENNQLTGTSTGQSIYIEDSTNTKVRSIGLSGNSEQDGTPTPENPVEIHSTGDSGSVNEKVQNKNLVKLNSTLNTTRNNVEISYNEQTKKVKFTGTINSTFTYSGTMSLDEPLKPGTYVLSIDGNNRAFMYLRNSQGNVVKNVQTTNPVVTITEEITSLNFGIEGLSNGATVDIEIGYQLEQGTTATDYAPHEEQDISFPLSQGQKLMQGDYLADDGIHHTMKQVTVSGTTATFSDAKNNGLYFCDKKVTGNLEGQTITFDTAVTTSIVQYELAEEVIEPYTEEQQAVWEQIKALRTYKPVTHISSTDEVPATVDVTYVKDWETVINNLGGA